MAEPHSLRPLLLRWSETAAILGGAAVALWIVGAPSMRFGWLSLILAVLILGAAAVLVRAAVRRALRHDESALGQVFIEERRVLYIGPHGNVQVALDHVSRVDLTKGRSGAALLFVTETGLPAVVPLNAKGSDALEGLLATLPGFSAAHLSRALAGEQAIVTLWSTAAAKLT